jgi:RNA polymerase sigma-70 factor (ECF subfamily)
MTSQESNRHDSTSASLLKRLGEPASQVAWDRFVRLYTPLLFYWARKAGLSETDCDDLVQEVFCVLVRKLPAFEYDASRSFRAWLRTVLLNTWHNRRRQKAAQPQQDIDLLAPLAQADKLITLEEAEYQQQLVARAVELMQAEFEPTTWQACWQTAVLDRPAATVARELGITVNAVYLAKSRVLARLRRELAGLWE